MGKWNCGSNTEPGKSVVWISVSPSVVAQEGFSSPTLVKFRIAARAANLAKDLADGSELPPACTPGRRSGIHRQGLARLRQHSRPISGSRPNAIFFRVFTFHFHRNFTPTVIWVGGWIVADGIQVSQVRADRSKRLFLVLPMPGKISFTARAGADAFEHGCRKRIAFGFPSADHVDGDSLGLRKLTDVFRRDHAGVVGAVGEGHNPSSAGKLVGVFQGPQERVVKRRVIASHCGTDRLQHLGRLLTKRAGPEKIPAVGIESHTVCAVERPDELRDGISGKSKTPVHIIAGVKEDKHAGARRGRGNSVGPGCAVNDVRPELRYLSARPGVTHASRNTVLFTESRNFLPNPVLVDLEISGAEASYIPAFIVRYRHIQLDHVDGDVDDRHIGIRFLRWCGKG